MIVYMIITLLALALAGLAVLNHAIKSAATGYEDEYGFHEGSEPQSTGDFAAALHAAVVEQVSESPSARFRTRRVLKRATKKCISKGSSAVPYTG
jgi:hypothetical protein